MLREGAFYKRLTKRRAISLTIQHVHTVVASAARAITPTSGAEIVVVGAALFGLAVYEEVEWNDGVIHILFERVSGMRSRGSDIAQAV